MERWMIIIELIREKCKLSERELIEDQIRYLHLIVMWHDKKPHYTRVKSFTLHCTALHCTV